MLPGRSEEGLIEKIKRPMTAEEKDALLGRLSTDSAILGGQVCVRGTRIPLTLILDALAASETIEDLLRGYPTLARDDVYAALAYGAKLAHERVLPLTPPREAQNRRERPHRRRRRSPRPRPRRPQRPRSEPPCHTSADIARALHQ